MFYFLLFYFTDDPKSSLLQNVFIGLAAVVGFVFLAFVVVTSYSGYKKHKLYSK